MRRLRLTLLAAFGLLGASAGMSTAAATELPPGASATASPPEFAVSAEDQRHLLRYPRMAGPETDDFSWWDFTAHGVAGRPGEGRRFVVVGALNNTRLPNGRLADGRELCELAVDAESEAYPHTWTCRTRIGLGAMNRRGIWWVQVAYAECPADGSGCASTSTVRYRVSGIMAPTRPVLPRRHVRVAPSHLESSSAAAGGLGFPATARVPVTCREMSHDRRPGWLDSQTYDCQHVSITLRTVRRVSVGGSRPQRWTLARSKGWGLRFNRTRTLPINLDTGSVSVSRALAVERMLRARGRLRVIATVTAKSRWDGKTRRARTVLILHAPKARPHGCRTGCLQP